MNTRHMEFFIETCKENSLTKASKNLHISQQGLSKAIKNMEEELGVDLFKRTTKGLRMTEYGERFREHCGVILGEYELMLQQFRLLSDKERKSFSFGYAAGILFMLPKNFISRFMMEYPDINLALKCYPDQDCERALLSKEMDMAFTTEMSGREEIKAIYEFRSKVYAMMSREHPLAGIDTLTIQDLRKERVIALNSSTMYPDTVDALHRHGIEPKIFINPSELNIQFDLCSANMAIGFFSGNPEHLAPDLLLKPVEGFDVYDRYMLVTLKETEVTDAMESLAKSISSCVEMVPDPKFPRGSSKQDFTDKVAKEKNLA